MAGYNFGDMKERVRRRCGLSFSDPDAAATVLGEMVNDACQHITVSNPDGWDWLRMDSTFPTVASTDEYTFATIAPANQTLWKVLNVELPLGDPTAARFPLTRLSRRLLDAMFPTLAVQVPQAFAVAGQQVIFRPIPDGVYTCAYHGMIFEPLLSDDDDEPLMPYPYRSAIIDAAAWMKFQEQQDFKKAVAMKSVMDEKVRAMRIGSSPTTGPSYISVDDGV